MGLCSGQVRARHCRALILNPNASRGFPTVGDQMGELIPLGYGRMASSRLNAQSPNLKAGALDLGGRVRSL